VMSGGRWQSEGVFPAPSDGRERSATIGPIEFRQPWQRVEIRATVPNLDNAWVDLDYTLVNRQTQQVYAAYGLAERYSGRDSDGDWTEGDRRSSISVASVPRGTYDLTIDYSGNRWGGAPYPEYRPDTWLSPEVEIEVRRGGIYASNLILALIFLAIPLIWGAARHIRFEQARQAESDYDPVGAAALFKESDE